jgi:hypothetical protein
VIKGGGTGGLVNLDIDASGVEQIIIDLAATLPQAEKALGGALRKMAMWLRAQSVKGLSKELKVQQRILRRRLKLFRVSQRAGSKQITVFYGLDPIAYIYLGTPRKTASGVSVGGFNIPHAFIARGPNGSLQVFKRDGKSRLPIRKQSLDVEKPAESYIEHKLLSSVLFNEQFFKFFEHELQWRTKTQR